MEKPGIFSDLITSGKLVQIYNPIKNNNKINIVALCWHILFFISYRTVIAIYFLPTNNKFAHCIRSLRRGHFTAQSPFAIFSCENISKQQITSVVHANSAVYKLLPKSLFTY